MIIRSVSGRNSVREALRILEDRGLIYVKTGSGVFINNPYGEHNSLTIQLTNCTLTEMEELQNALDHEAVKNAIEQMINKIRSYRFIQQEDSQNGNDSIWLATIPQHLALAQALKDCKLAAAIQAIDEINEYGFKIARSNIQLLKFICNYFNKVKSGNGKRQEKPCRQMDRASKSFTEVL